MMKILLVLMVLMVIHGASCEEEKGEDIAHIRDTEEKDIIGKY